MAGFPSSAVRDERQQSHAQLTIDDDPSDSDEPRRTYEDKSSQAPPYFLRAADWSDDEQYIDESPPWSGDEAEIFAAAKALMLVHWAEARRSKKSKSHTSQMKTASKSKKRARRRDRQTDTKGKGKEKDVPNLNMIERSGYGAMVQDYTQIASFDAQGPGSEFQGLSVQQEIGTSKSSRDGALLTRRDNPTEPRGPKTASSVNAPLPLSRIDKLTQQASARLSSQPTRGPRGVGVRIKTEDSFSGFDNPLSIKNTSLHPNQIFAQPIANPSLTLGFTTGGSNVSETSQFLTPPPRKRTRAASSLEVPRVEATRAPVDNGVSAVLPAAACFSDAVNRQQEDESQQIFTTMQMILDQQQEMIDQQMELFLKMKAIETEAIDANKMLYCMVKLLVEAMSRSVSE